MQLSKKAKLALKKATEGRKMKRHLQDKAIEMADKEERKADVNPKVVNPEAFDGNKDVGAQIWEWLEIK